VAAAIVRAARVGPQTDVLEVGAGLGVLTQFLVRRARRVVAVELDRELAETLESLAPNLTVVNADILQMDPATYLAESYTVVANLPYHITSPALRHLLASGPPFAERLVVTVQAEVAQRIAARPGEMSALAVSIQSQARVKIERRIPSEAFYPRPKVDSAVLVLEPFSDTLRPVKRDDQEDFVKVVQAGFKQPRKTLANSLADGLGVTRVEATRHLDAAGIDPGLRPQALAVEDWVRLFAET
jgi:16S rRNA (adenine1518-N6/adenine1519-N6)-dimethyltransferase